MAVLAIGAVAAWAAPVGYGLIAFNVATTVAGYMFAPKMPNQYGPRLGDLKVQSSTYGNPIPIVYGAARIAGNMIWAADIAETAHVTEHGGKGGGGATSTSYTYSQSFAVAVCEGDIAGIRKIWANGKLIYNLSGTADAATIAASNKNIAGVRIYTGSEIQTADSLIQAHVGAVDTPAYRGTAYIVFETLQLADYGNRTPNLEFEIVKTGNVVNGWMETTIPGATSAGVTALGNTYLAAAADKFKYSYNLTTWFDSSPIPVPGLTWFIYSGEGIFFCPRYNPSTPSTLFIYSSNGITWQSGNMPSTGNWYAAAYGNNLWIAASWGQTKSAYSSNGISWTSGGSLPGGLNWECIVFGNGLFIAKVYNSSTISVTANGTSWAGGVLPFSTLSNIAFGNGVFVVVGSGTQAAYSTDGVSWVTVTLPISAGWRSIAFGNGVFVATASGSASSIQSGDGITWTAFNSLPSTSGWTVVTYCAPYFVAAGTTTTAFIENAGSGQITAMAARLDDIVSNICTRAGLTAGQIDVTALTDDVHGYVVQRGTARSQLEQLMSAFYFDAVESDGKVKFVKRGGSSAVSIPEDDLAAHEYGSSPPDTLVTSRRQEMELPVEMNVQYMDSAAAYATGSQYSQRLTTESENKTSLNFAIAMTATKAKQIADVLMYDAWTSRMTFDLQTGWEYSYLEPTDIITVTKGGRTYVMRIVDEDFAITSRRQCVLEDTTVYTQSATAAGLPIPGETVASVPLTNLLLLDIPLLRDADDGYGFYAAACGYGDGWHGEQTFKSNDGGATWASYGNAVFNEATIGTASTALGDFTQNIFDELNSVTVVMLNGELSSDTEINILNGANVGLLGNEIIQFRDAALTATNTYKLTGLLRGRQGTEWARSTHIIGDRFVMLTTAAIYLMQGAVSEYDLDRKYRGVSFGGFLDDAQTITFQNTAVQAIPYAPVHLGGGRNAAGDLTLNWIRRTRLSGGWNNYSDVPLGESTEAYVVEIYSNSGYGTIKRTISGLTTATASYTNAMQVTDFGSQQATAYWKVYQVSATVGNGYEARGVT